MTVPIKNPSKVYPVKGIKLAAVKSNIRYADRLDLVLVEIIQGSNVVGVFTQNAFSAAPVQIAKSHLETTNSRFFLINTGNANAGTGEDGIVAALLSCNTLADIGNSKCEEILPFSTGVIGEPLPLDKILAGIPTAYSKLKENDWVNAATGIMTTDTVPKLVSKKLEFADNKVTITGIAKGSGMIKPNMATMLAFVFTDAEIERTLLEQLLSNAVKSSFNRITVDGDTSTNDACMLVATGESGVSVDKTHDADGLKRFSSALNELFVDLAKALIRDAEGASKFVTINVTEGASEAECLAVAYTVAESPLVKTALFASDANWGRILAAVGRAGIDGFNLKKVRIFLGDTCLVSEGSLSAEYSEAAGQAEMNKVDICITINLGRGSCNETVWTSDLSHDYVRINAEYRT